MSDSASPQAAPDYCKRFLDLVTACLDQNALIKVILAKYNGPDVALVRILIKPITVKGEKRLSFVYSYKTRDITKNVAVAEGVEAIGECLGNSFMSAHLFSLTQDVQMRFSRKGKCSWGSSAPSCNEAPSGKHNREKERLLDSTRPFLTALGVTDEKHNVIPSMSRKWKQINKFLEIFQHAFTSSRLSQTDDFHVVDFGAGKGYLTFAIHYLLRSSLHVEAQVTGIELREDLVHFCNETAQTLAIEGLSFRQGDVSSYVPDTVQIMIALHACDTATDQAIHMGIRSSAEIIMCAPCCHKQIRPQMRSPAILEPMLQFGLHLGQEAEMVTDSLRALLLQAHGYKTRIIEFVSLEHTSKNKMLLAVKHSATVDKDGILAKIDKIKDFYGIRDHCLETLLKTGTERPCAT